MIILPSPLSLCVFCPCPKLPLPLSLSPSLPPDNDEEDDEMDLTCPLLDDKEGGTEGGVDVSILTTASTRREGEEGGLLPPSLLPSLPSFFPLCSPFPTP